MEATSKECLQAWLDAMPPTHSHLHGDIGLAAVVGEKAEMEVRVQERLHK